MVTELSCPCDNTHTKLNEGACEKDQRGTDQRPDAERVGDPRARTFSACTLSPLASFSAMGDSLSDTSCASARRKERSPGSCSGDALPCAGTTGMGRASLLDDIGRPPLSSNAAPEWRGLKGQEQEIIGPTLRLRSGVGDC